MIRPDPLRGFRFVVEIEGIANAGFSRVKGLSRELKFESYREGGLIEYEHKLITQVSYPPIVLERGLALEGLLWPWVQEVADGVVSRKALWIYLRNEAGEAAWGWHVTHALPVKWTVSDLDAQSSQVAIESIEFAHHGFRKAT